MKAAEMTAIAITLVNPGEFADTMFNLWSRWQDEKQYEDIKEYGSVLAKLLPPAVKLVRTTKRPFGIVIQDCASELRVHIFAKAKGNKVVITGKHLHPTCN